MCKHVWTVGNNGKALCIKCTDVRDPEDLIHELQKALDHVTRSCGYWRNAAVELGYHKV